MDTIHILRGVERIVIVMLGGLSIYLGFALFKLIPRQRDNQGKVVFPGGISIFLSRVGPGVFFALFGTIVIESAMLSPVETTVKSPDTTSGKQSQSEIQTIQMGPDSMPTTELVRLKTLLRSLNRMPNLVRSDLESSQKKDFEDDIKKIKLELLNATWGKSNDWSTFVDWVNSGAIGPAPLGFEVASELFLEGVSDAKP